MAHSHSSILIHAVFSTKGRSHFIEDDILDPLIHYMRSVSQKMNIPIIRANGYHDHLHIFFILLRSISIGDYIKELKRVSSIWIKRQKPHLSHFAWQQGYSVFSVSYSMREKVIAYIDNQREHHKVRRFTDELRLLCQRHGVDYDSLTD